MKHLLPIIAFSLLLGCAGIPARTAATPEVLIITKVTARGAYYGFLNYVTFNGNAVIVSVKNIDSGIEYGSVYEHDGFCFIGPLPKGRYQFANGTVRAPSADFGASFSRVTNLFTADEPGAQYIGEFAASFGNDGFVLSASSLAPSGRDAGNRIKLKALLHEGEREKGWRLR